MEDERDAEAAIRALDRVEFGRKGRRLRVEWTKHERGVRRPAGSRRSSANGRPSKTLFVINFDTYHTRTRDLERHFEPYGKIVSVRIRRNFAFVQYESEDDASRALEATNMSKLLDRVISVEFAVKDDDDRRGGGYSPERGRDRQRDRSRDGRRSPSPYRRERGSPDYGRGPSPYQRERGSPDYGRGRDRSRSRSPLRRERASPAYGRRSLSPYRREREASDPVRDSSRSPYHKERGRTDHGISPSHSPEGRVRKSPQNGRSSSRSPRDTGKASPENGHGSGSPDEKGNPSPYNGYGGSPNTMPDGPDPRDSPNYGGPESPMHERYRSQSPPAEE
ncbi:serine/arginine-rich splicing factor RS40 isoform X2 [Cajanus cajan]|nr:serine/arginine-rich splicing factor RS40 isoform X2 [Cajanus cajan]